MKVRYLHRLQNIRVAHEVSIEAMKEKIELLVSGKREQEGLKNTCHRTLAASACRIQCRKKVGDSFVETIFL